MSMLIPVGGILMTGLGCSVGCGSLSTPLLLGRMLGEGRSAQKCITAMALFSAGKIAAFILLGCMAAVFGNFIITRIQEFHPELTLHAFRVVNMVFGLLIIWNVYRTRKRGGCKQCRRNSRVLSRLNDPSYFVLGMAYAAIPCGPVILALTYAATLRPLPAMALMMAFGIVNSLFSVVIYAPVIGTIVKAVQKDIPNHFQWIQVFSAVLLIGVSVTSFWGKGI